MNSRFNFSLKINKLIILLVYCVHSNCDKLGLTFPELEFDFNPLDVLKEHGYTTEVHNVTTYDGYILSLYRVPNPKGTPVIFHPALLTDASCFFFAKNNSLPFLLANEGYDVWLGNYRGTVYAKGHIKYTWDDIEYWNWSWGDMAIYDVPAFAQYVYQVTNKTSLNIGHSMGTTTLAAALASYPEIKKYMKGAFLLAPSIYLSHTKSSGKAFLTFVRPIQALSYAMNSIRYQLIMTNLYEMVRKGCTSNKENAIRCARAISTIMGEDNEQSPGVDDLTILRNYPRITSIHTIIHYGQIMMTGRFEHYNWGLLRNRKKYGTMVPPMFDLGKITVPVALFYGQNDYFGAPEDIDQTWREISDDCKYMRYLVPYKKFNHVDFLVARDVKELFYNKFLEVLRNFDKTNNKKIVN